MLIVIFIYTLHDPSFTTTPTNTIATAITAVTATTCIAVVTTV